MEGAVLHINGIFLPFHDFALFAGILLNQKWHAVRMPTSVVDHVFHV